MAPLFFWRQIQTWICKEIILPDTWHQLLAGRFNDPAGGSQLLRTTKTGIGLVPIWQSSWQHVTQWPQRKKMSVQCSRVDKTQHSAFFHLFKFLWQQLSYFPVAQVGILRQECWVAQLFVECRVCNKVLQLKIKIILSVTVSQSLSILWNWITCLYCHMLAQTKSQCLLMMFHVESLMYVSCPMSVNVSHTVVTCHDRSWQ